MQIRESIQRNNFEEELEKLSDVYICELKGEAQITNEFNGYEFLELDEIDSYEKELAFNHYIILRDYRRSLS